MPLHSACSAFLCMLGSSQILSVRSLTLNDLDTQVIWFFVHLGFDLSFEFDMSNYWYWNINISWRLNRQKCTQQILLFCCWLPFGTTLNTLQSGCLIEQQLGWLIGTHKYAVTFNKINTRKYMNSSRKSSSVVFVF